MGTGLYKLGQEDPSFHYSRDEETNQTVIEGMGELHLDIIVDRLRREFKVDCNVGAPQVNYREAITSPAGECPVVFRSSCVPLYSCLAVDFAPHRCQCGYPFALRHIAQERHHLELFLLIEGRTVVLAVLRNGWFGALHAMFIAWRIPILVCKEISASQQLNHAAKLPRAPVAISESICCYADVKYVHKKQSGGSGQFAEVCIKFEPGEAGTGFTFTSEIKGGVVPKEYIPGVVKGLEEMMSNGALAGYPVVDLNATLYDGNYHDVDSSVLAFQIAARGAFRYAPAGATF